MDQSKIMVNNQTCQFELLNKKKKFYRGGIFQCVREILQLSLPIDHHVYIIDNSCCFGGEKSVAGVRAL